MTKQYVVSIVAIYLNQEFIMHQIFQHLTDAVDIYMNKLSSHLASQLLSPFQSKNRTYTFCSKLTKRLARQARSTNQQCPRRLVSINKEPQPSKRIKVQCAQVLVRPPSGVVVCRRQRHAAPSLRPIRRG